eukprot:Gb_33183 [translate_table: standard]
MEFVNSFGGLVVMGFAWVCAVIMPRFLIEYLDPAILWNGWRFELSDDDYAANWRFSAEDIKRALPVSTFGNCAAINTHMYSLDAKCAVCLDDLQTIDQVRELPRCAHLFHKECIDSWIHLENTTCPLCRSSLLVSANGLLRRLS